MRHFLVPAICLSLLLAGSPPAAAALKYYPDPVYKKLNEEDPMPMADVIALAERGNVRAQFIVGDLYAKGKGGVAQDTAQARRWFETSAIHGYYRSFIRLAAIAKREGNPAEAWQWYTLAIKMFDSNSIERKSAIKARDALMKKEKLSNNDLRRARKSMKLWENTRSRRLLEEKEAARKQDNSKTATAGAPAHE